MPPEEQFGHAGVEQNAGFTPMPDSTPSEPADIGSSHDSLRDAANELSKGRGDYPSEPEEIAYRESDKHGRATDKLVDPKETITRQRAAEDLAAYRERREKEEQEQVKEAIRRDTDAVRSGQQQPQQQPGQQQAYSPEQRSAQAALNQAYTRGDGFSNPQLDHQLIRAAHDPAMQRDVEFTQNSILQRRQEIQRQAEEIQAQGGDLGALQEEDQKLYTQQEQMGFVQRAARLMQIGEHPVVATAFARREVLERFEKVVGEYESAFQSHVQSHEERCSKLIDGIESLVCTVFPEFRSTRDPRSAIAIVRQSNPQRADDMARGYAQLEQAVQLGMQASQHRELEKAAEFQKFKTEQGKAFIASEPEMRHSDALRVQLSHDCLAMLEDMGMTRDQVREEFNTNRLFNSAPAQRVMLAATKYWLAKRGHAGKRTTAEPTHTLRPGSSETRIDADRGERLPASIHGAKEATRLLLNRRSKRR